MQYILPLFCLVFATCVPSKYNSEYILDSLMQKAKAHDSFANNYIFGGKVVKRMSFTFVTDNSPFYSFRSEWIRDNKYYVYINNSDGKYDFEYFPDDSIAYQYITTSSWNNTDYSNAKDWHFDYKDFQVIGEESIYGEETYIIKKGVMLKHISKSTGLPLDLYEAGANNRLVYGNYTFDLGTDLFHIPKHVKVIKTNKKLRNPMKPE